MGVVTLPIPLHIIPATRVISPLYAIHFIDWKRPDTNEWKRFRSRALSTGVVSPAADRLACVTSFDTKRAHPLEKTGTHRKR